MDQEKTLHQLNQYELAAWRLERLLGINVKEKMDELFHETPPESLAEKTEWEIQQYHDATLTAFMYEAIRDCGTKGFARGNWIDMGAGSGRIPVTLAALFKDPYRELRFTGGVILVEQDSHKIGEAVRGVTSFPIKVVGKPVEEVTPADLRYREIDRCSVLSIINPVSTEFVLTCLKKVEDQLVNRGVTSKIVIHADAVQMDELLQLFQKPEFESKFNVTWNEENRIIILQPPDETPGY